ncbi:hypothetical protein AVEN_218422-1 [Araneus ventricosus]|uniref:Uncharacterized protein n=1 Tax=Araneus ventricosus TaxID=182803 RepID=A0A4Y2MWT9_ARAVE|nr:hypothetical protein AVEN_218422-1 [Araneus ventricosus]
MADSGRYGMHRLIESDDHLEELCEFFYRGGDPNQRILGSNTLLHAAAQSYKMNERVLQKLINAGADIEATTCVGRTPLQYAVMSRNRGAVKALIQAGARINVRNSFGLTALHYAIYTCHPRRPPRDLSWMHAVRCTPDVWIMKRLLDHGVIDLNPVDSKGETPLMWAVKYGRLGAVKTLLKSGANPNIPNKKGQNSLHVALSARNPNQDIITELLLNGVGIYDVDNLGQTPVDILLQNILDDTTFYFALECLDLIAFKYYIREDLECKLKRFPQCLEFLRKACQEVQWMNNQIIYDSITLHDFASGCFQERRGDHTLEIYKLVVEILLSGKSDIYFNDILYRMSTRDLCNVLGSILPPAYHLKCSIVTELSPYQTHHEIFELIQECVDEMR